MKPLAFELPLAERKAFFDKAIDEGWMSFEAIFAVSRCNDPLPFPLDGLPNITTYAEAAEYMYKEMQRVHEGGAEKWRNDPQTDHIH